MLSLIDDSFRYTYNRKLKCKYIIYMLSGCDCKQFPYCIKYITLNLLNFIHLYIRCPK